MNVAKPFQKRPRGSYKSEKQQSRVIGRKIAGESITEIARQEGISRPTVRKILNDREYQEIVRVHRQEVLDLIPESIQAYRSALGGINTPEGLLPPAGEIEDLVANELKKRMDGAYQRGLKAGLDAVRVATEVLKGTQVLVGKKDVDAKLEGKNGAKSTDELRAELSERLQRLADKRK
jgi:predicted transcriptional regulator